VVSSKRPRVAPGATVNGEVRRVRFANAFRALGWLLWLAWWLAVSVSTFVLGLLVLLLAPRVASSALAVARTRVGPAIGWGLALAIELPIVSILMLVTLVGIPLGLIGLLSLALLSGSRWCPMSTTTPTASAMAAGRVSVAGLRRAWRRAPTRLP
jgi:hypothetical protein